MPHLIQTTRLSLRPLTEADFPFMRTIHTNEKIIKHLGNGTPKSEEQSRKGLELSLKMESDDKRLGSWVVELKSAGTPIGLLILRKPATKEPTEGIEIGYSFHPDYWFQGYAQECARALVEYSYQQFGSIRIMALIDPSNTGSRNVLAKTGFVSVGMTEYVDPSTGLAKASEVLEIPLVDPR